MKKKIIIISIISVILISLSIGLTIFFVNKNNKNTVKPNEKIELEEKEIGEEDDSPKYFEYDYQYKTNLLKTPNDGTNPSNYDSLTNIYYALYNLEHKNAFKVTTTGATTAKVLFVNTEQKISNSRIVIGDKAMLETISEGMVKVAYQKYFTDYGNNVYMRETHDVNNLVPTYTDVEPEKVDAKGYIEDYGWLPFKAIGYIICDETVKEVSELKCENGIYEVDLILDHEETKAPYWYRREVKTTGTTNDYPLFSYVSLTYKFDSNWNIISLHTQEKYQVSTEMSLGFTVDCETNCDDYFSYENVEFNKEEEAYFKKYIS